MNQNVVFSTLEEEASIFKFDVNTEQPFNYELSHTVNGIDIYAVEVNTKTWFVANGDYIVIAKNTIYHDGICKEVEDVRIVTEEMLFKRYKAYDSFEEKYVNILEQFDGQLYEKEPSDEELEEIEAGNWDYIDEDDDEEYFI